jgi:hypothetical protein
MEITIPTPPKWVRDCEICNVSFISEVDRLIAEGNSEWNAVLMMHKQLVGLYGGEENDISTTRALLQRYRYYRKSKGKFFKETLNKKLPSPPPEDIWDLAHCSARLTERIKRVTLAIMYFLSALEKEGEIIPYSRVEIRNLYWEIWYLWRQMVSLKEVVVEVAEALDEYDAEHLDRL